MNTSKKVLLAILGGSFLLISLFIATSFYFEFSPEPVENAMKIQDGGVHFQGGRIRLLTWNIGYAGLGKDADFFLDGGKTSKPDNIKTVKANLDGIKQKIKEIDADIVLLQEVDADSSRTFNMPQMTQIADEHRNMDAYFATNFQTFFVPVPWYDPMGKIWSGIMTLSRFFLKDEAVRISLPGSTKWPEKMFDLKRCMLVTRIALDQKGKDLVMVNLHLSAFDDGYLKGKQLEFVMEFLLNEYELGNIVIAGGDWNHSMPGINKDYFGKHTTSEENLKWLGKIDEKLTPNGWRWVFEKTNPSVRSNEKKYVKGENFTTVVDGFLISPGIEVNFVKNGSSDFKYSDHEPVVMEIDLL